MFPPPPAIVTRALQGGSSCFVNDVAYYPFNFNEGGTPFQGIMFNVASQGSMVEVLTLELDIALETADTDLSVEVYVYNGGDFTTSMSSPEDWFLLANTELVLYPDSSRGAILPAYDFRPFTLGKDEVKTIYINMNGPWVDNSINSVGVGGQPIANDNMDLVIYPGAGLTSTFPSSYDASAQPIFAGGLHLRKEATCANDPETTIDFLIATDRPVTDELLASIAESVDMTMESVLRVDSVLVEFQNNFDLKQVDKSTSQQIQFSDHCEWERCSFIETTVMWTHQDDLNVEEFIYRMYSHTKIVKNEIEYILPEGSLVQYVGKEATKVEFQFYLKDVKAGLVMDQSQSDYFAKHTLDFINSEAPEYTIEALSLIIDKDEFLPINKNEGANNNGGDGDGRRRDLQELGQLELQGRILGTRYNHIKDTKFALQIQDLYRNPGFVKDYVKKMAFGVNFPGPMNEFDRHKMFEHLVTIEGYVEVEFGANAKPTPAPTDPLEEEDGGLGAWITSTIDKIGSWKARTWIFIGVSILAVLLAVASFLLVRWIREEMESKKRREERQVDKEYMRQEKRLDDIRRKRMQQQYDGDASIYSADDQSMFDGGASMADSYVGDDALAYDQPASYRYNNGGVPAPVGSRRNFYGPALAQLSYGDEENVEQPRGPVPRPPARAYSGTSRGSGRMPPAY